MLSLALAIALVLPQESSRWCGLDTSKVYVTENQPTVGFLFEPQSRRVYASLLSDNPQRSKALGFGNASLRTTRLERLDHADSTGRTAFLGLAGQRFQRGFAACLECLCRLLPKSAVAGFYVTT